MKFKNISTLGALEVPALNRVVEAGETFEVPADLGLAFAGNGNFEPVDKPAKEAVTEYAARNAEAAEAAAEGDAETDAGSTGTEGGSK